VRDNGVKQALKGMGVACDTFNADLLYEPWEIYSDADGRPFTSFEPFWAKLLAMLYEPDLPALAPKALPPPPAPLRSASLEELGLMSPDEAPSNDVLGRKWTPGEEAARVALDDFLAERLKEYAGARALSDTAGTSQLSPYLHFGEISVRRVWYQTKQMEWLWAQSGLASHSVAAFQRALGLREYGRYLSFHFPFTHERALLEHLRPFPWRYHAGDFKAWRQGATGYPLVDAGMRQLWATGWLHNRVRRVVATFLVKHLLLPWQWGLKHYWDTLLDADLESDVLGWQFVSGGLPDSPPFGALESIEDEARRYDPHGHFVRRWVPQLARVPTEWIHAPWKAPQSVLDASGVEIGTNYPAPIVQPAESQARLDAALGALAAARGPGALAEEAAAAAAAAAPAPGVLAPPPPALFAFADEPPAEAQQAQHVPMEPPPAQAAPAAVRPPRVHCAAASGEATGATGDVAAPSGAPAGPRTLATVLLAATRRGDSSSGSASPRLRAAGGAGPLPPARRPSRGSRGGAMSSGAAGSEPVSGTLAGLEAVAAATAAAHASMAAQHAAATALVAAPPQGLPKRKRSSAADLRAVAEDALSH
jgi:deoxyribodipyrimidine photolyase